MAANPKDLTPQQLINAVKSGYGMTWDELGEMMGRRSARLMRKIATGQTSGESFREALIELHENGSVQHPPPRRRARDGHIVPVRAKAGAEATTVVPEDDKPKIVRVPSRGKFVVEHPSAEEALKRVTLFREGNRVVDVRMPKSRGAKGRKAGMEEIKGQIRRVTKGQRANDKRVKIQAIWDTGDGHGRVMDIGAKSGYHASDILGDIQKDFGGDFESWIRHHSADRYDDLNLKRSPVIGVTMIVFDATRTKDERKQQDEARTRRRRWRK
jgi:hypothetical protein